MTKEGQSEKLDDVAELNRHSQPGEIASGISNTYNGPPYNAGSADVLGKVEIKDDGSIACNCAICSAARAAIRAMSTS